LPSQRKFHHSTASFKGFSGPVGSGKSAALCFEALRMSYQNPGRMGLVGAPTYPMLRDITQPALLDLLTRGRVPYTFNKSEKLLTLTECGSRILFRSVNHPDRLRGTNLAWFGVDELTFARQEAWERLEARLRDPRATRRCGFGVWTPRGFDWVYRKFISDPVKDYKVILAQPYENRFVLDAVPDYYEHLKHSYDEEFFKQEVLGQYLNVGCGLVYHQFNRKDHVRDLELDPNLELLWSLDFNVDPMSSVIVQTRGEEIRVLDEIVIRHANTEDACIRFLERYRDHPSDILIYGDSSGRARHSNAPRSDYEIVRATLGEMGRPAGLFQTTKQNPLVQQRVRLMNRKLRDASGRITLFVDPKCRELIKDFEQVSYKEGDDLEIRKQRARTHTSDALGYVVCKVFDHLPDIGPQDKRLV